MFYFMELNLRVRIAFGVWYNEIPENTSGLEMEYALESEIKMSLLDRDLLYWKSGVEHESDDMPVLYLAQLFPSNP